MNSLDEQYIDFLEYILDNGIEKKDRTGTGTLSVFGLQFRHDMSEGFPLLTTKKMYWKGIVTELLWFLRGDTNIKYLVDNNCHIWDGDCYQAYLKNFNSGNAIGEVVVDENGNDIRIPIPKDKFIEEIKLNSEFAKKWGELGPIYGKQWRSWAINLIDPNTMELIPPIDQIQNLINELKTNPDSRRLMVSAWNVGELDQMVLPPCHYGFQVYTRELSLIERGEVFRNAYPEKTINDFPEGKMDVKELRNVFDEANIPTRAISLMWNQRSVDTFLGLPFNIASYGLLLEIIAKAVNMVPDQLIGNLGDVHLYNNHIEQAKEQIGRDLTLKERRAMVTQEQFDKVYTGGSPDSLSHSEIDQFSVPKRTREPYPLPKLNINTEFWPYEGGECGEGPLDATAVFNSFKDDNFCKCLLEEDIQLGNYQSHPTIKAPLSN